MQQHLVFHTLQRSPRIIAFTDPLKMEAFCKKVGGDASPITPQRARRILQDLSTFPTLEETKWLAHALYE